MMKMKTLGNSLTSQRRNIIVCMVGDLLIYNPNWQAHLTTLLLTFQALLLCMCECPPVVGELLQCLHPLCHFPRAALDRVTHYQLNSKQQLLPMQRDFHPLRVRQKKKKDSWIPIKTMPHLWKSIKATRIEKNITGRRLFSINLGTHS